MAYAQSRKDCEFLENIRYVDDIVEVMSEVTNFMQTPTKAKACEMYNIMVSLWFEEHRLAPVLIYDNDRRRVKAISERHGVYLEDTQDD